MKKRGFKNSALTFLGVSLKIFKFVMDYMGIVPESFLFTCLSV